MKLLLTGLPKGATGEAVREGMKKLGPVSAVEMVVQAGSSDWAIVEMPITDEQAFNLTQRVRDIWHAGQFVNLTILNH